jgi:hypothetical protein
MSQSEKVQVTLGPWTMTEGQRDALVGSEGNPGLFERAGFTLQQAQERWGRVDGWKLVGICVGIVEQAQEAELVERMAGQPVSTGGDFGGQLGFMVRLQKAAAAAGLELVDRSLTKLIEDVMLDVDGADWVKAHRVIDRAVTFFEAAGVELPARPERKEKASNNGQTPASAGAGAEPSVSYPSK